MVSITILYPSGPEFNLKYYMDTHMPLVAKNWKPFGLQSWEIIAFEPGQTYQIQASLKWDSAESWASASAPSCDAAKAVFGDIPNFTTAQPVVLKGAQQGMQSLA
ncbi:hypothetical protein K4F52_006879 [Lecanicillium sp. MT-2017a]|nr:hypothetical protein K4F52_006879 [Lecanicillium sp. MT-2017a]